MMNRLTGWIGAASAPLLTKIAIGLAGAAAVAALGVWLYVNALQGQVENRDERIAVLNKKAGALDTAVSGLELDNARLAEALKRQTNAVQALAAEANAARKVADRRAAEIAALQTPAAGEGAAAMLAWWGEHVVQ